MTFNTGLQASTNGYTYWSMPKSKSVTMTILNNGVDVGFGQTSGASGPEAASYPPSDEYFPPGSLIRPDLFDAIRIKSHVTGSPAQYSISARLDAPDNMGASFSPTYQTIDPVTGAVGANFSGIIDAAGVILPPSEGGGPGPTNRIQWQRLSDGAVVATIGSEYGAAGGDIGDLFVQATSETAGGAGRITISAFPQGGAESALLSLLAESGSTQIVIAANGNGGTSDSIRVQSDTGGRVLWDGAGNSAFVQAAGGLSAVRLAFGTTACTFSGSSASSTQTVNTGLPGAAQAIFLQPVGGGSLLTLVGSVVTLNAAGSFNFIGFITTGGAATGTEAFYWAAIG